MNDNIHKTEQERIIEKENNFTIIEKHEQFYTVKDNANGNIFTIDKEKFIKPKSKKEIWEMVGGIVFIVWFVFSLGLIIYLSKINTYYMVICFGQYFLIFGLIALFKKVWPGIIFAIVGLALIIIPILMLRPSLEINWDRVIPTMILGVFLIVGCGLLVVPMIINKKKEKVYSLKVMAKVIKLEDTYSDGMRLYAPVYEYYFNNKTYQIASNTYSNINVPEINEIREIKINPLAPEKIYVQQRQKFIIITLAIMGIIFIIMSCVSLYLFIFKN